jgi:HPt (histidine-containing phosphotransfer) domain-containing protein
LVKISDQIDSIQEIPIFPCFLNRSQGFSDILMPQMVGRTKMGSARRLSDDGALSPRDCVELDVGFLNNNTFGDLALRREILSLFAAQIDGLARTLELPVSAESWHFLTHTMKGASAAVGAKELEALALRWSKLAAPTSLPGRQSCARELAKCFSAYKKEAAKLA